MNWETYNTMTETQKEEYKFRFGERTPIFNITGLFSWITIFLMMVNFLLYSSYLFMVGEHFIELKPKVEELLVAAMSILQIIIPIIIFAMVWDALGQLIFQFRQRFWLKKNGIKYVYKYKKWFKWIKNKRAKNTEMY